MWLRIKYGMATPEQILANLNVKVIRGCIPEFTEKQLRVVDKYADRCDNNHVPQYVGSLHEMQMHMIIDSDTGLPWATEEDKVNTGRSVRNRMKTLIKESVWYLACVMHPSELTRVIFVEFTFHMQVLQCLVCLNMETFFPFSQYHACCYLASQ